MKTIEEMKYADALKELSRLEKEIEKNKLLIKLAKEANKFYSSMSIETFSDLLRQQCIPISKKRLYKWLRRNKYLSENNILYQHVVDRDLFKVVEVSYRTVNGVYTSDEIMVTPIGQSYFYKKLRKEYYKNEKN